MEHNIRFLKTWLVHVRAVGIEGGIHDLEFQKPEQVAELILGFLGEE